MAGYQALILYQKISCLHAFMGTDILHRSLKCKKELQNTHDTYAKILYRAMPALLSYRIPALPVTYLNI